MGSLFRDDNRLSEFSGFSLPEKNKVVPQHNKQISSSGSMLCQRMDDPSGDVIIHRTVRLLGRFHIRPLQFFLRISWNRKKYPDSFVFRVTPEIKENLRWWSLEEKLSQGKSLLPLNPNLEVFSDTSNLGWGALLGSKEISGALSPEQRNWHINVKELKAVYLGFQFLWKKHVTRQSQCTPTVRLPCHTSKTKGNTLFLPLQNSKGSSALGRTISGQASYVLHSREVQRSGRWIKPPETSVTQGVDSGSSGLLGSMEAVGDSVHRPVRDFHEPLSPLVLLTSPGSFSTGNWCHASGLIK